jgi:peptide/nickel transport system ATP-binding protein
MRQGRLVEYGTTADIFAAPREAYTRELLAAIPRISHPSPDNPATRQS